MKKVFLGGTCNNSLWRDQLIPKLNIAYFNPVVDGWNNEAYQKELHEREHCDYCLYVITPKAKGFYSIAEAVDDSNKRSEKTVFCFLGEDAGEQFEPHQLKSLIATRKLIEKNGGKVCDSLQEVAAFLNGGA
jgi:hypothetical protein